MANRARIELFIDAINKPYNLPDPEGIIQQCRDARSNPANSRSNKDRGVPLVDKSAWVKYGRSIDMGEALTQDFVAKALERIPNAAVRVPLVYLAFRRGGIGYIVMEYIDGSICDHSDVNLVAAAVQSLIQIKAPNAEPGPVGGGEIGHRFFVDWKSSLTYNSVQGLEKHINSILAATGRQERVSFKDEINEHGLPLCPCDMDKTNFMRDINGDIVALDFGASCFLPPSFFAYAVRQGDHFAQRLGRRVQYPKSTQLNGMLAASCALVPFGSNDVAVPAELKPRDK